MATSQSSEGWGGVSGRGVDGDQNGIYNGNSCTHTHAGPTEWWQVDLGAPASIDHVDLYHRTDCCENRLTGGEVFVSDTTDYTAGGTSCGSIVTATVDFIFCGGASGQFVTVKHNSQYITICEAEVYAGVAIPLGAQMLGGDGQLVADTQLADVAIPLDYEIGLDITPGSNIIADWAAIVHFTATGTNCCDYGSRIPGVWF